MTSGRVLRYAVRRGVYYDSLALMGLHAALAQRDGVVDAGAVMATRTNLELLAASGLGPSSEAGLADLGPEDLLVVVSARSAQAADAALDELDGLLKRAAPDASETFRPRSLEGALRRQPGANWAAVSVPGRYAATVARDALHLDLDVFLYSDNVSVDDEVELKRLAERRGRMVLGPDCGTAVIGGVGLGFANRVRRGPIGLVGASGTGLQAVAVAIDRLGGGISQAIGTGGRDLSAAVGGATAHRALDRLAEDAATEVVVLISKRPEAEVAEGLLARAARIDKPVVIYFQGAEAAEGHTDSAASGRSDLYRARSLRHAAEVAQALALGRRPPDAGEPSFGTAAASGGCLRGLFAGGTLAAEVLWQVEGRRSPLHSNVEGPWEPLEGLFTSRGHTIVDLGDDAFTRGRLHPMIDPTPQAERLVREARDPETGVVLFDVVLGDGACPDPAALLAPAAREALEVARSEDRALEIVALVIGTASDPQDYEAQVERLADAGVAVADSVEVAVAMALGDTQPRAAEPGVPELGAPASGPPSDDLAAGAEGDTEPRDARAISAFATPEVVNVGLESFFASVESQGADAVHVDWRPSAGGNERMASIIERLKANDRRAREAVGG